MVWNAFPSTRPPRTSDYLLTPRQKPTSSRKPSLMLQAGKSLLALKAFSFLPPSPGLSQLSQSSFRTGTLRAPCTTLGRHSPLDRGHRGSLPVFPSPSACPGPLGSHEGRRRGQLHGSHPAPPEASASSSLKTRQTTELSQPRQPSGDAYQQLRYTSR